MRAAVCLAAFVGAAAAGVAAAQPIQMSPELAKFMSTPDEERNVKSSGLRDWQALVPSCPSPSLAGANVVVHVPPKFDPAGQPVSGFWQVVSRVQGCGQTRQFNLFYTAANGKLTRTSALPGTTIADLLLQKDGLMYASMAMVKIAPADCKDYKFLDTAFEAFGTAAPGARARPWTEKWTVSACGVDGVVKMRFTPDAKGTQITANTADTVRLR